MYYYLIGPGGNSEMRIEQWNEREGAELATFQLNIAGWTVVDILA